MNRHITGLDNVVVAVRDLDQAAKTFQRLGFTLTPKGHHAEWGTANHCVMFGQDYIVLLAAEGVGEEADGVREFTRSREGMQSVSLGTSDGAATVQAMRAHGFELPDPRSLSRRMDDGTTMMFSQVELPVMAAPGIRTRLVQHITAERERNPQWLDHTNGAIGIASVTAIVDDPLGLTEGWDRLFGPHAATPTDDTVTVHTGRGLIFLSRPEDLTQLHPEDELEEDLPPPPALMALSLQVADADAAARLLKANDVEFSRDTEGTIRIPPSEAHGVYIELIGG